MTSEVREEIESLLEDPCPACGGVHLSIDQMDTLYLDEFKVGIPCGGSISVSPADISGKLSGI